MWIQSRSSRDALAVVMLDWHMRSAERKRQLTILRVRGTPKDGVRVGRVGKLSLVR